MAATTTYLNQSSLSATATQVTLNAYTAPSGRAKPLLRIDDEIFLITDTSNSPTLGVVRGYMGTLAVTHSQYAGAIYGSPADMQTSKGPNFNNPSLANPRLISNVVETTATGSTGSTAAIVNVPLPAIINCTGSTGGVNLPVPAAGDYAIVHNAMSTTLKIYGVGSTLNGNSGTTGVDLTSTGNKTMWADCSTAGAWRLFGNT